MKTRLTLAALLAASLVWAQGPMMGPGAPPTDLVKTYLKLTDTQIQSLTQIRQQGASSRQSIMQDIHTKQQALHDALDKGGASATTLGQLLLDIQSLQKKISDLNASDQASALAVLTDAQKTSLKALQSAADLQPTIGQAAALGLLDKPPAGPGMGPMMHAPGMGPMMRGPGQMMLGPGPMMQHMRPGQ